MANEFETYKLTATERMLFEKLDRIIDMLERQGSVRPG